MSISRMGRCNEVRKLHVNGRVCEHGKCAELVYEIADDLIALFLLCGLPEQYEPKVMALDSITGTLKLSDNNAKLLQEKRDVTSMNGGAFFKKGRT